MEMSVLASPHYIIKYNFVDELVVVLIVDLW